PIPPILSPDKKEIILVTHDECIFYSNDGKRGAWARDGELPLKKKGNGRCIMVSEFLTEIHGRLCLNQDQIIDNPDVPEEAKTILKPGKNHEGYWKSDDLVGQEDALVVNRMNLSPGGKKPKIRNTTFGPNNTLQHMVFEDGTPKGMRQ
ncbi:22528_t:CDS:2, partial [Entrophospora sp. SA101]